MTDPLPPEAATYDGVPVEALAARLGVPRLAVYERVGSTMDVAHALAASGAPDGTLVLADAQAAGRGRAGRRWESPPGQGIWCTLVARPSDARAVAVLSLRVGLHAAMALAPHAAGAVTIKWPNDLWIEGRKLAGILVEARWRDAQLEWVAIGFGCNVRAPAEMPAAIGLGPDASRVAALEALVPALRAAAAARGPTLGEAELAAYAACDAVRGRRVVAPVAGVVRGIAPNGEIEIVEAHGGVTRLNQATLAFAE